MSMMYFCPLTVIIIIMPIKRRHYAATIVTGMILIAGQAAVTYSHSHRHATGGLTSNSPAASATPTSAASTVPEMAGSKCHMRGQLPDPICTPGSIDPAVTDANVATTICVSGYTASIRPSSGYTTKLKKEQMIDYGFTNSLMTHEEDHLISLELGGAAADPTNLWPEPGASPNPKDKVENFMHAAVCAGRISLSEAQKRIATDWTTAETGLMNSTP